MIKPNPTKKTIGGILKLRKNNMLQVNPEYQRGAVWTKLQQQKLIDSVLRGYPLPLIYLHHIKREVEGMTRDDLEIIDGQQRINSFHEFSEDSWALLNPQEESAKFPFFLKDEPCDWADKKFSNLSSEIRERFLNTPLSIVEMECSTQDEVRDLFTRLQAGTPLSAQEKRDAMVGDFAELVLTLGGKPELRQGKYRGHDFFTKVMRAGHQDRGQIRQLVGQILMLYLHRQEHGGDFLPIKGKVLDDTYYRFVGLNSKWESIDRFKRILDRLAALLGDGARPPLKKHDAIHLILLADSLWDNYTHQWEGKLAEAYDAFADKLAQTRRIKEFTGGEDRDTVAFLNYFQKTKSGSAQAENIKSRHEIYLRYMRDFLGASLVAKDTQRGFDSLQREIIYYRDNKTCWHCGKYGSVKWDDAEIHHVIPHSEGGQTVIENGALLHQNCHRHLTSEDKKKLGDKFKRCEGDINKDMSIAV